MTSVIIVMVEAVISLMGESLGHDYHILMVEAAIPISSSTDLNVYLLNIHVFNFS